jgi:hypothetical protein
MLESRHYEIAPSRAKPQARHITSHVWESLDEIRIRTGLPAERIGAAVAAEHRIGGNECRFVQREGQAVTEWRRKELVKRSRCK